MTDHRKEERAKVNTKTFFSDLQTHLMVLFFEKKKKKASD